MLFKLRKTLERRTFNVSSRGILKTPPVVCDQGARFSLLSQIRHDDVQMYLLAVKSFARQLAPKTVFIVDDGSLTAEDIEILDEHVPGHLRFSAPKISLAGCPRGGTWERLITISQLVSDSFIIQLDADTVTFEKLSEVAECVAANRSFSIGTWDNQRAESMQERLDVAKPLAKTSEAHIQIIAEAHLDVIPGFETMKYIRGCSGFSGFAKGSFNPERLSELSSHMGSTLGERWSEWGTEQFMSNVIVANSSEPVVLPHPKYCDCTRYNTNAPAFVHFIGTCRFAKGRYASAAIELIERLAQETKSESCLETS